MGRQKKGATSIKITRNIKIKFGEKVKHLREKSGYKQEELAELIGLGRISIVNIEAGRQWMSIENFYLLCQALKCTPNDLLAPIEKIKIKKSIVTERVLKTRIKYTIE